MTKLWNTFNIVYNDGSEEKKQLRYYYTEDTLKEILYKLAIEYSERRIPFSSLEYSVNDAIEVSNETSLLYL